MQDLVAGYNFIGGTIARALVDIVAVIMVRVFLGYRLAIQRIVFVSMGVKPSHEAEHRNNGCYFAQQIFLHALLPF